MKQLSLLKSVQCTFLLFYVIMGSSLHAATYYVSTSGNDTYTSTQAQNQSTPWKTIEKINQIIFSSGDIVLFKRGEVFRGQVKAVNGVTYGAYGLGNDPIISGSTIISAWSLYKGNIYVANVNTSVKNVIVNNKQMTLARFPNQGFLTIDKGNGTNNFIDNSIQQPSGYWNGATLRLTLRHFSNYLGKVTSQSGTSITFSTETPVNINDGYPYYFDNKLSELDAENEWFYDSSSQKLYLYAPNGVNPSSLKVEAVTVDYGFRGGRNANNVTIKDLQIEKQALDGIYLYDGAGLNNSVISNKFYFQGENGISFMGNNMKIEGNYFSDINGRGVACNVSNNSVISNNTIKRIGLKIGYGVKSATGHRGSAGIVLGAHTSNFKIANNQMDSLGYIGIRPDGTYHTIEKNVIKYSLLVHSDGGAIYAWGDISHHLTIKDNFLFYPKGYSKGELGGLAYGIYLDVNVHHCTVINNTIVGSEYGGILLNTGNHDHVVKNNTCFANKLSSIKLDDWTSDAPLYNNVLSKNIIYSTDPSSMGLFLNSKFGRYNFGKYDSNYYCNPYSDFLVRANNYLSLPNFTLSQWKAEFNQDAASKKSLYKWQLCESIQVTGTNLISNGDFNSNTKGWSFWNQSTSKIEYLSSGIDDGSLKYTMLSGTSNNGFVISPSFSGIQNQMYELKFSAKSTQSGRVTAIVRQATSPYGKIYAKTFPLEPTRGNYSAVFKMPISDSQLRLDFEIFYECKNFTIDNVSLTPVKAICHEAEDRSFIYTNPSNSISAINLAGKVYKDLNGNSVSGSLKLDPWSSKILVLDLNSTVTPTPTPTPTTSLRIPENPTNTVNGVKYSYYEGAWTTLPNFSALTPVKTGTLSNFSIASSNRTDYFGFSYNGYISVPVDGVYTFYTSSDDGSRLYIGNTLIVDNDGLHGLRERSGTIGLKAGKHLIKVLYFESASGQILSVSYAGPGITKKIIPSTAIFYQNSSTARVGENALEGEDNRKLIVYPNPARNDVAIYSSKGELSGIRILSSQGVNYLNSKNINSREFKINVDQWPQGVYLLEVEYVTKEREYQRLIIKE